jgi:hypothetical protein
MLFFRALITFCLLPALASAAVPVRGDTAELVLANRNLRAVFSSRGLASLADVRSGWLDWTDANAALLKRVKPIIGPPMIGRCDGTAAIDGAPVTLIRAYNSIYGHEPKRTFLGLYADVTGLDAGREHAFELALPALAPGRFQGLFFENVEPEFTTEIRADS